MSEQINKVLASTAQSFSTAEQKQARDNIAAQASGDYVEYSAISGSNNVISSINGSALSSFSGVWTTPAFTGSGTNSLDKLGLNSAFAVSASGYTPNMLLSYNGVSAYGDSSTGSLNSTSLTVKKDLGGSTAYTVISEGEILFDTPYAGTGSLSSYFSVGGMAAYGNFASDCYTDSWKSAHRFQGTGDTGNGLIENRGYFNGTSVIEYPSITMYTPTESATIYMSSISGWDNKLSAVNVGFGLSGNGNATPLAVTALQREWSGAGTVYKTEVADDAATLTVSENGYVKDKAWLRAQGVRVSACDSSGVCSSYSYVSDDTLGVQREGDLCLAQLFADKLRLSQFNSGYDDLTRSSIKAIDAVYNWATSQGMPPIV